MPLELFLAGVAGPDETSRWRRPCSASPRGWRGGSATVDADADHAAARSRHRRSMRDRRQQRGEPTTALRPGAANLHDRDSRTRAAPTATTSDLRIRPDSSSTPDWRNDPVRSGAACRSRAWAAHVAPGLGWHRHLCHRLQGVCCPSPSTTRHLPGLPRLPGALSVYRGLPLPAGWGVSLALGVRAGGPRRHSR